MRGELWSLNGSVVVRQGRVVGVDEPNMRYTVEVGRP